MKILNKIWNYIKALNEKDKAFEQHMNSELYKTWNPDKSTPTYHRMLSNSKGR